MDANKSVNDGHSTSWERIYDKVIVELKTNLIYVLVLVLGYCLYKSWNDQNGFRKSENAALRKERDEWKSLALKAISRNFDYVDILFEDHERKNDSVANAISDINQRR